MRWFLICFMLAISVLVTSAAVVADGFVSGIDGLPLMPGLVEREEAVVIFEAPEGRIVESLADGEAASAAVLEFYSALLPQLGWRSAAPGRYLRDAEELRIEFLTPAEAGNLTVRFALAPAKP